jgi:hypothetical protein
MDVKEERITEIHQRVEQLDALLAKHVQGSPADDPQIISAAMLEFFSDRRDERRLLLEELDRLLKS